MTEKLYYNDAYLTEFRANVLRCEAPGDRFHVILDRSAFYPEGGGQRADIGTIGKANVLDVVKRDGEIIHITDREISGEVECTVDFEPRYRMMQNHTAEHICCGIFHRLTGAENVGFHMGSKDVTFDLDIEVDADTIAHAEYLANEAVFRNMEVRSFFPAADELGTLEYRSKGEFATGTCVRIVEIGDADRCACSALHVKRTGEIGRIKLVSYARYKGGMRFHMLAGYDALEYDLAEHANVSEVSRRLSAKPEELSAAVEALEAQIASDKAARRMLSAKYCDVLVTIACTADITSVSDDTGIAVIDDTALFLTDVLEPDELRMLANFASTGFRHAIALNTANRSFTITAGEGGDAREFLSTLKEKLEISGGGKSDMVSGRIYASNDELLNALGCRFPEIPERYRNT